MMATKPFLMPCRWIISSCRRQAKQEACRQPAGMTCTMAPLLELRSAVLGNQARHAGEHTVIMLQALDALDEEEKGHTWLQHFVADFRARSAPAYCWAAASEHSHVVPQAVMLPVQHQPAQQPCVGSMSRCRRGHAHGGITPWGFWCRFLSLMPGPFRGFPPGLAMGLLDPQLTFSEAESAAGVAQGFTPLRPDGAAITPYDTKRLQVSK